MKMTPYLVEPIRWATRAKRQMASILLFRGVGKTRIVFYSPLLPNDPLWRASHSHLAQKTELHHLWKHLKVNIWSTATPDLGKSLLYSSKNTPESSHREIVNSAITRESSFAKSSLPSSPLALIPTYSAFRFAPPFKRPTAGRPRNDRMYWILHTLTFNDWSRDKNVVFALTQFFLVHK